MNITCQRLKCHVNSLCIQQSKHNRVIFSIAYKIVELLLIVLKHALEHWWKAIISKLKKLCKNITVYHIHKTTWLVHFVPLGWFLNFYQDFPG